MGSMMIRKVPRIYAATLTRWKIQKTVKPPKPTYVPITRINPYSNHQIVRVRRGFDSLGPISHRLQIVESKVNSFSEFCDIDDLADVHREMFDDMIDRFKAGDVVLLDMSYFPQF